MKRFLTIHLLLFLMFSATGISFGQTSEIRVKFNTFRNSEVYLGFHFGTNKYIRDTFQVNSKGIAVIQPKEPLKGGIYLIITPDKNYFEVILSEPRISVETDTGNFVANMKIIESRENKLFYEYLGFMQKQHEARVALQTSYNIHKENADSSEIIIAKLREIDDEVKKYRQQIINANPDLFFSRILLAMDEPIAREKHEEESDSIYSAYLYSYFQLHFFDNIDFSDDRILRTPIFEPKVDKFLERLTIRHPDSIKYAAGRLLDKTLENKEIFKFTLIKVFNKYVNSKYMGMDAISVYLIENYYLTDYADWVDSTQRQKLYDYLVKNSSNQLGMKAPELIMKDTSDNYQSLHSIKSIYTILLFWDASCSHCKKMMPQIRDFLERKPADSFRVFAVYIGNDLNEWRNYLRTANLPFIHVSDPMNFNNFRTLYNVFSSPILYLIDKEKKIAAKRIDVERMDSFINVLEGRFELVDKKMLQGDDDDDETEKDTKTKRNN